ncbi:hypothetical protein VA596_25060 [Amycolatopsis sp., V23-08]|uniref:Uncharacterized protein n=1 Tax=Amycolatopsis heterodermiae TaxID=3110235 RepID=A0ABU5R9A6_9PSEU|nr:hypothetical protein [Amycolatopsis sp., V23-08]MEA5362828.1 hypothetical protein [Amycolatopsis sp., V23-08]
MPDTMQEVHQAVDGERGPEPADDTHLACLERARRTPALAGWQLDTDTEG